MRSRVAALAALALLGSACNTRETISSTEARVRNQPPASCTQDAFGRCPELAIAPCPDGQEPVIDYSSDCCPHFSCQDACVPSAPCPGWPAPVCPAGTRLEILTASDCCPAYRCEPTTVCDPSTPVACPAGFPYCGEGVEPIVVGYTDGCCPIYQCPCERTPGSDPTYCGCTYPTCAPGEQLSCLGDGPCGYPCECVPGAPNCISDADCGPYQRCDLTSCMDTRTCASDFDCPAGAACPDGACIPRPCLDWGVDCGAPSACLGVCVGYVQEGCRSDLECPVGQMCEIYACTGWGCAPSSDGQPCAECAPDDVTCVCSPDGSCTGQGECEGRCVPANLCDTPMPPGACPPPPMPCDNPVEVGFDWATCCPVYECPACEPKGVPCPVGMCYCGVQVGTDADCCPIIYCPDVTAPEECPTPYLLHGVP